VRSPIVEVTSPASRDAWTRALEGSAEALAFHTPAWVGCICESGKYEDASRLYETEEGRRLVLPLVRRTGVPGPFAIEASLPHGWGFGGVVASGAVAPSELTTVLTELAGRTVLRTSLRPNPLAAAPVAGSSPRMVHVRRTAHVLPLDGGFEQVWSGRFTGTARTAVRKAERSSLVVEGDSSGRLVSTFYDLYLTSIERWARESRRLSWLVRRRLRRQDPLDKFELVAERMGEACRIWVAWLDGRPVAAIIVLTHGANASYWRGAMDKDLAGPTRANYLLHSRAILSACQAGCRYYHMGETGSDISLAQFKSRFGAQPQTYLEHRVERLPITSIRNRLGRSARRLSRSTASRSVAGR